jgi:L-amino acid N-acyltransferase YncA
VNSNSAILKIEPLNKKLHDRTEFDCGVPVLNSYLQQQAAQDMEKRAAVVYVALIEPPSVVGYYTLSQYCIELTGVPEMVAKKLARYPAVSTTLLGRLARTNTMKGQGLGEKLLFDALRRSLAQSIHIASAGVVVDAKDEHAGNFYLKYGFSHILDVNNRLFLPMKTIERIFQLPTVP